MARRWGAALALASAAILTNAQNAGFAVIREPARALSRAGRPRVAAMSGSWRGEYSYDAAGLPPVPFNAELIDVDGRVEGRSDEPNTFGAPGADRLFATLEGSRSGHTVRFVKTYDGSGGQTHAIAYEGRLSADGLRIEGRWRINFMAGAFFMEREPPAVAETAEPRAAEAEG